MIGISLLRSPIIIFIVFIVLVDFLGTLASSTVVGEE